MKTLSFIVSFFLFSASVHSQGLISPGALPKSSVRPIANPQFVIQPGRAKIELFPSQRVEVSQDSQGTRVMTETSSASSDRLSRDRPVLVFNHAYQQFGYATGEIAFKFKDSKPLSLVKSIVPGAEAIGTQFYVVNVQTPADILSVTQRLKGRSDIDWVIPTVKYLPLVSEGRE